MSDREKDEIRLFVEEAAKAKYAPLWQKAIMALYRLAILTAIGMGGMHAANTGNKVDSLKESNSNRDYQLAEIVSKLDSVKVESEAKSRDIEGWKAKLDATRFTLIDWQAASRDIDKHFLEQDRKIDKITNSVDLTKESISRIENILQKKIGSQ